MCISSHNVMSGSRIMELQALKQGIVGEILGQPSILTSIVTINSWETKKSSGPATQEELSTWEGIPPPNSARNLNLT